MSCNWVCTILFSNLKLEIPKCSETFFFSLSWCKWSAIMFYIKYNSFTARSIGHVVLIAGKWCLDYSLFLSCSLVDSTDCTIHLVVSVIDCQQMSLHLIYRHVRWVESTSIGLNSTSVLICYWLSICLLYWHVMDIVCSMTDFTLYWPSILIFYWLSTLTCVIVVYFPAPVIFSYVLLTFHVNPSVFMISAGYSLFLL